MTAEERKIIENVIQSLIWFPADWKRDAYSTEHKDGVRVRLSIGAYYTAVTASVGGYEIGQKTWVLSRDRQLINRLRDAVGTIPFAHTPEQAFRPFAGNGGPL